MSVLARFKRTRAFFFFVANAVVFSRFFFVVTGRCVDKGSPDRLLQKIILLVLSLFVSEIK
jgi:hypothetical protein